MHVRARFVACGIIAVLLGAAVSVQAAPVKSAKAKAPATMKCPACGMPMGMKKSAAAPVAMKMAKGTYYCCAGCAAGKKMSGGAMGKMPKSPMKMPGKAM